MPFSGHQQTVLPDRLSARALNRGKLSSEQRGEFPLFASSSPLRFCHGRTCPTTPLPTVGGIPGRTTPRRHLHVDEATNKGNYAPPWGILPPRQTSANEEWHLLVWVPFCLYTYGVRFADGAQKSGAPTSGTPLFCANKNMSASGFVECSQPPKT